jgi:hypothetical protein
MIQIPTAEKALKVSYPGYFEMSIGEMDEYVSQLSPDPTELESQTLSDDTKGDTINVQHVTQTSPSSLLFSANAQMSSVTSPSATGMSNSLSKRLTCPPSPISMKAVSHSTATVLLDEESMDMTALLTQAPSSPMAQSESAMRVDIDLFKHGTSDL